MPHFISPACTKCGACLLECPTGSIIEIRNRFVIDIDTCADHAACAQVCPAEAIVSKSAPPESKRNREIRPKKEPE